MLGGAESRKAPNTPDKRFETMLTPLDKLVQQGRLRQLTQCSGRSRSVRTTIFPPAIFSSMQRCTSTMSSRPKILPTWTRGFPGKHVPYFLRMDVWRPMSDG
jgi:hypothetical protein